MNYEEKYKSALEWMRSIYPTMQEADKEDAEHYFPELRESKDERIRKEILNHFNRILCGEDVEFPPQDSIDKWIAWLEKQGEKTIPKNIDDAALQYVDTCAVDGEVTHGNITEPYWNNHSMMNAYKAGWLEKQDEQPAWNEEDEKMMKRIDSLLYSQCAIHGSEYEELHKWLKSIKPNHWKPSEEQMEALKKRTHGLHTSSETRKALESLINDLEKLRLC